MTDSDLITQSLVEAIEVGSAWTPAYFEDFIIRIATQNSALPHSLEALRQQEPSEFECVSRFLRASGIDEGTINHIAAEKLAHCIELCECDDTRTEEAQKDLGDYIHITRRGIVIKNAVIVGELELAGLVFERPIAFENCIFTADVNFSSARLGPTSFKGSKFVNGVASLVKSKSISDSNKPKTDRILKHGIHADGANFSGTVILTKIEAGFVNFSATLVHNTVSLEEATIGPSDPSISAVVSFNAATLETLIIRRGARIVGGLDCISCKAVELDFSGANIQCGDNGFAILARSIRIRSQLKLSGYLDSNNTYHPTVIEGACFFADAQIEGDLRARGIKVGVVKELPDGKTKSHLEHIDGFRKKSLSFPNATIGGSVFLEAQNFTNENIAKNKEGGIIKKEDLAFEADGEMDFRGAEIGGDLRLENAHICAIAQDDKKDPRVLDLRNAVITRMLVFKSLKPNCRGLIDLRETQCQVYRDDFNPNTWPKKLRFLLVGFKYRAFALRDGKGRNLDEAPEDAMILTYKVRKKWLQMQPPPWVGADFQPQPWVQCARVLAEMGFDQAGHKILERRERLASRLLNNNNTGYIERTMRSLLVFMCGHGHAMQRLLLWATIAIIIGIISANLVSNANLMRPTNARILVDETYKESGQIPLGYSPLRPTLYGFARILPTPPLPGRGEWEPCTKSLINDAINAYQDGEAFAPCLPADCGFPTRYAMRCEVLPVIGNPRRHKHAGDDGEQVVFDILSASPRINAGVRAIERSVLSNAPVFGSIRYDINKFLSRGGGHNLLLIPSWIGWISSLLLATFAAGYLKRKE